MMPLIPKSREPTPKYGSPQETLSSIQLGPYGYTESKRLLCNFTKFWSTPSTALLFLQLIKKMLLLLSFHITHIMANTSLPSS